MPNVMVDPQPTPNPNAMKFNVSVPVTSGKSESFTSAEKAESSPLGKKLFGLAGISNVFLLGNFVTVNKTDEASWNDLIPDIVDAIESTLG